MLRYMNALCELALTMSSYFLKFLSTQISYYIHSVNYSCVNSGLIYFNIMYYIFRMVFRDALNILVFKIQDAT